jgi:hypothetical protein
MHEQFCCTNVASKHFGYLAFTTVTCVLNGWCAILAYDGTVNSIFRYNSVVLCKLNKKIFTKKKKKKLVVIVGCAKMST